MSWLNKLKDYAPSIASAILSGGATLPQLALKAISDATGIDVSSEDSAKNVIESATPEQMLKIKQADNSFKIRMRELDNELTATELKDVQNARDSHKHSAMPMVICLALTAMVTMGAVGLFTLDIPDENKEIAYLLFGTLLAKWGDSIAYWVGTTRSSAEKSRGLAK
jgi:hypothetical protein